MAVASIAAGFTGAGADRRKRFAHVVVRIHHYLPAAGRWLRKAGLQLVHPTASG
jgi:hypothetical protein